MGVISSQDQNSLINFTNDLLTSSTGIYDDVHASTKFEIGHGILRNRVNQLEDYYLITQDESKPAIINYGIDISIKQKSRKSNTKPILSIGTFEAHNRSKQTNDYLITVPVPLVNDSFCTDRCNPPKGGASFCCRYPDEIIIDLDLLNKVEFKVHLLGLGEFISVYYSILDYSISRKKTIPNKLLFFISGLFSKMSQQIIDKERNEFLSYLSAGLVLKGCLMRCAEDHEIGCCGDHLIGGILEEYYNFPHGQAVYYGAILMSSIFPGWEQFGLLRTDLLKIGKIASLIDLELLSEIQQIPNLKEEAISSRPERKTLLQNM